MYRSPDKSGWKDQTNLYHGPDSARWHHVIEMLDLAAPVLFPGHKKRIALLGFCSDEAHKNWERRGASEGPQAIRRMAANMPWHLGADVLLYDAGDVLCSYGNLPVVQKLLGLKVASLLEMGCFPVLLGGGHEMAYGHFLGAFAHRPDKKIGIIHLGAHFGLQGDPAAPASTPFLQIASFLEHEGKPFNYLCLGTQPAANTRAMYKTAEQMKIKYLEAGTLFQLSTGEIEKFVREFAQPVDHIYLTVCLDVLDSAFAPGVSTPTVMGLAPQQVAELISMVMGTGKVLTCDIADMNPAFDHNDRTAQLAAHIVVNYLAGRCAHT